MPAIRLATASGRTPVETEADQTAAFGSLIAYIGRYWVEGNNRVTNVDVSADPAAVATNLARFFDLQGDNLEIKTAPFLNKKPSAMSNKQLKAILLWERERT